MSAGYETKTGDRVSSNGERTSPSSPHGNKNGATEPRGSRLSTGALLFIILTCALAPLGAISVAAGVRTIISSETERGALLQATAETYSARLQRRFGNDQRLLNSAVTAMLRNTGDDMATRLADVCRGLDLRFNGRASKPFAHVIDAKTGGNLCVGGVPALPIAQTVEPGKIRIDADSQRLILTGPRIGGNGVVELVYPIATLRPQLRANQGLPPYYLGLNDAADNALLIRGEPASLFPDFSIDRSADVGRYGLSVAISARSTIIGGPELVGLLTPIGMWLLAAILSWLVIDRILLGPIQSLGRGMARYRPGDSISNASTPRLAAREVTQLQSAMMRVAATVAQDKTALANALSSQHALNREVHHRVKNNLQIIASMVSLHSRDATGPEATMAYRTIQRRVDALGVVQRHLRTDQEGGQIALDAMLGELVISLRHSMLQDHADILITLEVDPLFADQDVAMPVAFLVTELVELSARSDHIQPITIRLLSAPAMPDALGGDGTEAVSTSQLSIASAALASPNIQLGTHSGYQRVITGLARQLRQPLEHLPEAGWYAIMVPANPVPQHRNPA